MASLRNATIAYAVERDGPGTSSRKLDRLVRSTPHDYFATILCAAVEIDVHRLTLASAGHFAPLLGMPTARASPICGSARRSERATARPTRRSPSASARGTLVAYTDGLIERRGEVVDVGLARLRDSAAAATGSLDEVVSQLIADLRHEGDDDTTILGVRWRA